MLVKINTPESCFHVKVTDTKRKKRKKKKRKKRKK